jgi:catechol 1,2-dioxygenase
VLDCEYDVKLLPGKYKPDNTMLMGNANGEKKKQLESEN